MPAIVHRLQARILESSDGSGGISGTAIALIVVLAILPAIALIWTVCYLFWAYPNDRNCCCMRRKRRADKSDVAEIEQSLPVSEETVYEKPGMALPKRPFSAQMRTESGNSSGTGRITKQQRPGSGNQHTRMSMQSVASTIQVAQEPKPFV